MQRTALRFAAALERYHDMLTVSGGQLSLADSQPMNTAFSVLDNGALPC
jgi:hypothetical protein